MAQEAGKSSPEAAKPNPADHLQAYRWQRGQSGNPGGRLPGLARRVKRQTKNGKEVVDFYVRVLRGEPVEVTRVIRVADDKPPLTITWHQTPDLSDRLEAAKQLRDTGWGKPKESVEVTTDGPLVQVPIVLLGVDPTVDPLAKGSVRPRRVLPERVLDMGQTQKTSGSDPIPSPISEVPFEFEAEAPPP